MTEIKFKKDCTYHGKFYSEGYVLKNITPEDLPMIWKLNEKGFIYPLSLKEFMRLEEDVKNNIKKEDK